MMNAGNLPAVFRFLLCLTVIYFMLAWCSDIAASDNARRPYVPSRRHTDQDRNGEPGNIPRISRLTALAIRFEGLIRRGDLRDYADLARLGCVTRAWCAAS